MLTKLRQSRIVAEMSLDAFGKIFESLYTGSMVRANTTVFALWPYCIAHAKPPGYVEVNPEILAFTMSTTVESIQEALDYLCSPDPKSRSKREGGRRLVKEGEFLYRMVNFIEYRDKISAAAKRENDRARIAAKRAESRKQSQVSQTVVNVAQAEAEAEAVHSPLPVPHNKIGIAVGSDDPTARKSFKVPSREEVHLSCVKSGLPVAEEEKFWNHYMSNGWKVGKNRMQSLPHAVGNWAANWRAGIYSPTGKPTAKSPGEKNHERDLEKMRRASKEMEDLK
jgi:hypothetical protein